MNVKINAQGYKDKIFIDEIIAEGNEVEKKAIELEKEIIEFVNSKMS
jgi:glutamate formiminotransferase/formiminotetrahydrofolate cyclodeaminase